MEPASRSAGREITSNLVLNDLATGNRFTQTTNLPDLLTNLSVIHPSMHPHSGLSKVLFRSQSPAKDLYAHLRDFRIGLLTLK